MCEWTPLATTAVTHQTIQQFLLLVVRLGLYMLAQMLVGHDIDKI